MDDKYLFPKYEHRQGESLLIPCKPTHPNVTVSLSREKISTNGEWDWDNIKVTYLKNKFNPLYQTVFI